MKPEYLDTSDTARQNAVNTVVEILKTSKVKLAGESSLISVLEPAMPAAIKALYKSGFHRTTSSMNSRGYLTLRRLNILVDVQLPLVKFGADVLVKRLKKSAKLFLMPISLSKEGVIARTKEDSLIDISYASMLAIYKETDELNAWRNHMQFTLPENRQIVALIALLDRCIGLHESGSAVDYDRYDVRWGDNPRSKTATRGARLIYAPSSGRYEIEVKVDAFSWSSAGSDFNYPETAADLKLNVERHLETPGDTSPYHWLTDFHRRMLVQLRDMSSPHYEEAKHLA
ncbi:hypothetical protein [Burkholderia gladioli]|uniref:hypothetical protein n=1 Tax=Burkholderia gladioli TaxID=28095 RepID=UPI00163F759B|nr:hypothetical protein [Burkholderia gladioli]